MKNINTKKGFTIIEVVLVLAIAGLIFLMVFVALPNLQRSQRDTQRRQDYANFAAGVQNYISNHGGNLPAADTVLPNTLANSTGTDPAGTEYIIAIEAGAGSEAPVIPGILLVTGAQCSGETTVAGAARQFAVMAMTEDGSTYCQSYN